MAKQKTEPNSGPKARGRPKLADAKGRTPIAITIRANSEWEEWFDLFSDALRREMGVMIKIDRTDAIDIALAKVATAMGLPKPPSRY